MSMAQLMRYVPSSEVSAAFRASAKNWPTWDSEEADPPLDPDGCVHFDYNGEYDSERVLVLKGSATLTPDDGSPPVTITAGDAVHCHFGLSATWKVHEPVVQAYGYFASDGAEIQETELTCDVCGEDCFAESYLNGDEDICPRCFELDARGAEQYEGAQYCINGEPTKVPPKKKKRASEGEPKASAAKKPKKVVAAAGTAQAAKDVEAAARQAAAVQ
eukprot:4421467-Prymnesium_polylepis.1